jgi:subtilisin family serine protease
MKVTVKEYLNVRVGKPSVNAPTYQYLAPGSELEVDGILYNGDPFEGTDKWLKDGAGNYYWAGGIKEVEIQKSTYPWWLKNNYFSIPDLEKVDTSNIKIALLDTGISVNIDFDFSKITGYNYIANSTEYKSDPNSHGTHCAGIIAAQGKLAYGIAPGVQLYIAKVCNDAGVPSLIAVKNALTDIYNGEKGTAGIKIINMSFNLAPTTPAEKQIIEDIKAIISKLSSEKNCLLVSACGDEDWEWDYFPASLPECISVGSINQLFVRSDFSTKTSTLDIAAPGEKILSLKGTSSSAEMSGTSMSAAFVSGVCALGVATMKDAFNSASLKKILFQSSYSNGFSIKEYGHGIVNPTNFLSQLK